MSDIAANTATVLARIKAAAERGGRKADEVTLIAVTKTHPVETVIAAYQVGLNNFAENRTFEQAKIAAMSQWVSGQAGLAAPSWHFIGHLQTRQVAEVLGKYQLIHSVDSVKLAQRINRLAERDGYPPVEVLLQCNVSGEAAKSGFELSAWSADGAQLQAFIADVTTIATLNNVVIRGLMTMAPITDDPETVRYVFQNLAGLHRRLQQDMPQIEWRHLSMGMTDDFEVAIEEGATMVRVGRAIFGERQPLPKQ